MSNAHVTQPASPRRLSTLAGLWPFLAPTGHATSLWFLCLASGTILLVHFLRDLIDFGFGNRAQTSGDLSAT